MIDVACAVDERYAADCAVLLASLASSQSEDLRVHLLHTPSLTADSARALAAVAERGGATCIVHPVAETALAGLQADTRFPAVAWLRVLLPGLLPDLERVLYLDSDTLVLGDLGPLWATDLGGSWLGAVTNPLFSYMVERIESQLGLPAERYFNSGVLLLDLAALRGHDGLQAVRRYATDHRGQLTWPDQDALNAVLHGRRHALHPRWNAMFLELPPRFRPYPGRQAAEALADPAIVHYVGPYKPWHHRCRHPYRAEWFRHLATTPWAGRDIEGRGVGSSLLRLLPMAWVLPIEGPVRDAVARSALNPVRVRHRLGGWRAAVRRGLDVRLAARTRREGR